jgi:hypothetical protein
VADRPLGADSALGGVPLWIRLDNLKTAVALYAEPTAVLNRAYQTLARTCGSGVDVCRPATPTDKGKVEHTVASVRNVVTDLLTQQTGGTSRHLSKSISTRRTCNGPFGAAKHRSGVHRTEPLPVVERSLRFGAALLRTGDAERAEPDAAGFREQRLPDLRQPLHATDGPVGCE